MRRRNKEGQIRIIGGDWRSRRLPVLAVDGLRPTGDRIRETLFNWLQSRLVGARVLDVFAGTGALGFEALSRGAALALMIEQHPAAQARLEQNKVLLSAPAVIRRADARAMLAGANPDAGYDIVFVDPPFADQDAAAVAALLADHGWLADGGVVYVEQSIDTPGPDPALFRCLRESRAGRVQFGLYSLAMDEGATCRQ